MSEFRIQCPVPFEPNEIVVRAHGGGGRMTQRLIDSVFAPLLSNPELDLRHDAATLMIQGCLAVSTDSYVVNPWRFPGGNIGSLAVHGTVNDLAMAGARPVALTAGFVLEEGFPLNDLQEVVYSMAVAADEAKVTVVAADTKVVERGHGDGIYINTTGIGEVHPNANISPRNLRPGDVILVSGDLGRHGIAVMTSRDGLDLQEPILSDSASVVESALALIEGGIHVRCLRDATRGGLASVLNELATSSSVRIRIEESKAQVQDDVAGVCELLGLDPLYVACEGRYVAIVPADEADHALEIMRAHPVSSMANQIGVVEEGRPEVLLRTRIGLDRILDLLSGEQLPRIC